MRLKDCIHLWVGLDWIMNIQVYGTGFGRMAVTPLFFL